MALAKVNMLVKTHTSNLIVFAGLWINWSPAGTQPRLHFFAVLKAPPWPPASACRGASSCFDPKSNTVWPIDLSIRRPGVAEGQPRSHLTFDRASGQRRADRARRKRIRASRGRGGRPRGPPTPRQPHASQRAERTRGQPAHPAARRSTLRVFSPAKRAREQVDRRHDGQL